MAENAKVSGIRFKGFTDAWEQRKLGEVFTHTVGYMNPQKENIELWSLTLENGLTPKTERYIRDFLVVKEDKFKVVHPNDVVYNPMNMTLGAIGYNDMLKTVAVSGYYITMRPSDSINGYYIKTWMLLPKSIELYKAHATGSLLEKQRVQYPTFSEIKCTVPSLEEQKKISAFFKNLDNLITLHQRKLLKLKNVKKAMLEKMFPKNGSNVPEIRFKGFTDAWEQRKLGEVLSLLKDGTHGTHIDVDSDGVYLLSAKNIKNGKITFDSTDRRISKIDYEAIHKSFSLQKYDVLITIVGSIGESAIIENPDNITFQRSVAYLRPNIDITSKFLFTLINTGVFQNELKNRQVTSAQSGIYLGQLNVIPIKFPKVKEQTKIGEFFSNLDNLITINQRKLEKLKNIKKACLENMFV